MYGRRRKKKVITQLNEYFKLFSQRPKTANNTTNQQITSQHIDYSSITINNSNNTHTTAAEVGNITISNAYSSVMLTKANKTNPSANTQIQESINQEKLNDVWRRYMRSVSASNPALSSIMDREISFNKNDIIITLDNAQQASIIQRASDLKQFLRNELKNIFIEIVPSIKDTGMNETMTVAKIQSILIENNHALKQLIETFNLVAD